MAGTIDLIDNFVDYVRHNLDEFHKGDYFVMSSHDFVRYCKMRNVNVKEPLLRAWFSNYIE